MSSVREDTRETNALGALHRSGSSTGGKGTEETVGRGVILAHKTNNFVLQSSPRLRTENQHGSKKRKQEEKPVSPLFLTLLKASSQLHHGLCDLPCSSTGRWAAAGQILHLKRRSHRHEC